MDDSKIILLYLNRIEDAISQTSIKYGHQLRSIASNIVVDKLDAEECENDTYLSAWNSIPPHEPRTYLFSFLAKIVRNKSIDLCKKKNRKKRNLNIVTLSKEMEECIPSPNDDICRITDCELIDMINQFLYSLDITERSIFIQRYWYFESIKTISKNFYFTESKVKSMLFRTRIKLKEYLLKEGFVL